MKMKRWMNARYASFLMRERRAKLRFPRNRAFRMQTPTAMNSMPIPRWSHALVALALAIGLAGCTATPPPKAPPPTKTLPFQFARANVAPVSGTLVSGSLRIIAQADGVYLTGEIGGLGRGRTHAIHIHERGDCSAADGSSAGGHFNPAGVAHGRAGSGAHHAGDMDNLVANEAGVARVDMRVRGLTLGGGGPTDIIRRAIVVHASPDDYSSQPAGNAGARIACGVIDPEF